MKVEIYICNVCGKEYDYKEDAVHCHPDIVVKKVPVLEYKTRSGKVKCERIKTD